MCGLSYYDFEKKKKKNKRLTIIDVFYIILHK